jgi:hypothetical protein
MQVQPIDYLELTRKALRGVMSDSLSHAAENGLVGEQHFYITFRTNLRGVVMPDWLQEQYPEEMTIVVQHEYWDLAVMPDRFSIGLSFNNRSVTLVVPFASVKTFADPSVNFQLDIPPGGLDQERDAIGAAQSDGDEEAEAADETPAAEKPDGEATVVSLDAFRKK